ncbi:putative type II secretion system protein E [Paenibacillus larvae subsp. larvae]|nr:putative type II secretion system protein E [Paenibacillus larvae subsp. larvae]
MIKQKEPRLFSLTEVLFLFRLVCYKNYMHFVTYDSLSTGHANSGRDMLSRLETMVLSGASLPIEVIRKQICSALDILIHLSRLRDGSRRVTEVNEIAGMRNGEIEMNPLFRFEEKGETEDGRVVGNLVSTGCKFIQTEKLKAAGLKLPACMMGKGGE